jgi:hypothetical protein
MFALILAAALSTDAALAELDAMCRADEGKLWGRSLCGPVILADPTTRDAVTMDEGRIGKAKLPESIGIANTAVEWNGRTWTMVMLPLPEDAVARKSLLAHESFHRVQKELGFPPTGPANNHLDTTDGRYLMRLEWRALAAALNPASTNPRAVIAAIEDALAIRAKRRALTKEAGEEERQLEMHEGLAEHTGLALAAPDLGARTKVIVNKLTDAEKSDSFVRSFAYASGPAWGALIERRDPQWTRTLKPTDDLGEIARRVYDAVPPNEARDLYGKAKVLAEETARTKKKEAELAALRKKFVDDATLTLPLGKIQLVFDPNGLQPLEGLGTVYRKIEITDQWGKIVVSGGALLTSDWKKLIVPASGEGYTLTMNEGWRWWPGKREGDVVVGKR